MAGGRKLMTAQIIDGKKIAAELRKELALKIAQDGAKPKLAVIWVGNNEASRAYVRNKQKAAEEVGIVCDVYHLAEDAETPELMMLIERLNMDRSVNGIIVQLPLPAQLHEGQILEAVRTDKDVDAFKQIMTGALWQNKAVWASATPQGIIRLLKTVCDDLSGKHAVVIGRSNIVGKPVAALLLNEDCTVTIAHSKTVDLPQLVREADIVVAACGCPKMVKADWVKKGAIVIDVGITRVDGKLCGDVDFDNVAEVADAITPVPGGVGPMTVAMLLQNTYTAYLKQIDSL